MNSYLDGDKQVIGLHYVKALRFFGLFTATASVNDLDFTYLFF